VFGRLVANAHPARVAALIGIAAASLVLAGGSWSQERVLEQHAPDASARVDGMTLEQQVGQVILLRFRGTTAPEYVREALRQRRVAGAILFGDNVGSRAQLHALTTSLRSSGSRPIVAVDQEGGSVRRIPRAAPFASAPEQVVAGSVRSEALTGGKALRVAGITVTLAPVADVPSARGAALAGRAFSSDPDVAGTAMTAAVLGWRSGGVAATAKHFPGLGGARANTDNRFPAV
jgi:beta-N-acetylhexosaminidase